MNQAPLNVQFLTDVVCRPAAGLAGRWSGLRDGQAIAKPSSRRPAGDTSVLYLNLVRALAGLLDGKTAVRFVGGGNEKALVAEVDTQGTIESFMYRTRARQVYGTSNVPNHPDAMAVFAARLIANRGLGFPAAYLELLRGISTNAAQPVLDELMATASDELLVAAAEDLNLDSISTPPLTVFVYNVNARTDQLPEFTDTTFLPLTPLFTDSVVLSDYLGGKAGNFAKLAQISGTASAASNAPVTVSANAFIGEQVDTCLFYALDDESIMWHGPTGTGKSFGWHLMMARYIAEKSRREVAEGRPALEPFDPDKYNYFVHGSGGLEDIDLVGATVRDPDTGEWCWKDGPLTRAMLTGNRLRVDEMNRMNPTMLNILIPAMDGRMTIPQQGDRLIVAKSGFGVDAMANIGREYTATEELDPAIIRRFPIKVEFDFLKPEAEAMLLRSRHAKLTQEQAEALVSVATLIREGYAKPEGGVEIDMYVSPAALLNSAKLVARGLPYMEAIRLTWLADVGWTKTKREAIAGIIEAKLPKPSASPVTASRTRSRAAASTI